jgi:hypothetical protein
MSINKHKPLNSLRSSHVKDTVIASQAVYELLTTKETTNTSLYTLGNTSDIDLVKVSPLLQEIKKYVENYKAFVPKTREVKTIGKYRKSKSLYCQPYTSFGYSELQIYKSIHNLKIGWVTFRLSEKVSRTLYKSKNPTRTLNNLMQYHLKKSISGIAKGMFVIERSMNRPIFNVIPHRGKIKKMDYQLHAHMLIAGTEFELERLCGKHKDYKGLKNLCPKENNAIVCSYSYIKKNFSKVNDRTVVIKKSVSIDRGAADYMSKEADRPIVQGSRNFSFFGIESEVINRWERTVFLQRRLLKICDDVINQLKLNTSPEHVLYQTIKTLLK